MAIAERKMNFPFTAVVGMDKAKLALLCAAVDPLIGGVLLRGDKGTGKSTLVRAFAKILPEIDVVADCPFNCNPHNPLEMCDSCYERYRNGKTLPLRKKKMKLVDVPLSTTPDRLVGTVDVERFLKEGTKALQPGLLAEANRGVLYIDEVNLLDDYVADSLLDAAAMGWNIIEREGISFRHPARFVLVGSMNPEEGDLRPQILDRFGLCVDISAPTNIEERIEIVNRVERFHRNPVEFHKKYEEREKSLRDRIITARQIISEIDIPSDLLMFIAETVVSMGIKTNRAEIVTVKTAKAIAALNGRKNVTREDVLKAMDLALPHRIRAKPFEKKESMEIPNNLFSRMNRTISHGTSEGNEKNKSTHPSGECAKVFPTNKNAPYPNIAHVNHKNESKNIFIPSRDTTVLSQNTRQGMHIYSINSSHSFSDVDFYATAIKMIMKYGSPKFPVKKEDIMIRVRRTPVQSIWTLLLDSSGSMSAHRKIEIAKGVAWNIVERGYMKRSKICLILARGKRARIAVPPTKNYWRVIESIENAPTGGRTPIPSALKTLIDIQNKYRYKNKNAVFRCFLITDGKANVSAFGKPINEEMEYLATQLKKANIDLTIIEPRKGFSPGYNCTERLKEICDAKHIVVS